MTLSTPEEINIAVEDGHRIQLQVYSPAAEPVGVIQVLHGLGEHAGRYTRFAAAANEQGFAVCLYNHRGHGPDAEVPGYYAAKDGWHKLISDALLVHERLRHNFPSLPITLLGHSMGSFIAAHFAMLHGDRLAALLLSGSTWPSRLELAPGNLIARLICWRYGDRHQSPLLDKLGFGDFNKRFKPARTEMDWLSRDEEEVDLYVNDPLCGGPYTAGLWRDFLRGLFEIGSDNSASRIPISLPILITGGADDPVGGDKGMGKLALHYAQTGHTHLKVRIFEGGRHEMLNETNREEVTRAWLAWIRENTVAAS